MAELVHDAQHEFWRPPVASQVAASPAMLEACDGCGTEFMVAARFCHVCGTARQTQQAGAAVGPGWTRHLEFQNIKRAVGLSTASLIAFSIGLLCLLAVMGVGIVYTVQKGDTLAIIAKKTGAKQQDIVNANKLTDPSRITVGQQLFIPGAK